MEKSKKRGERRWRSYCTWMRRLKGDWATHGRGSYPVPIYGDKFVGGRLCVIGFRDSLCECFDLRNKQALRFKDTPNTGSFRRKDWDKYRTKRRDNVPIQERRSTPIDREYYAPRKRRRVVFQEKVKCSCGYFLGFRTVEVGVKNRLQTYLGGMPKRAQCPDCIRRQKMAGEFYGVSLFR